jgi:hypothetical protein
MTVHRHLAEVATPQCFRQSVFAQPRPKADEQTKALLKPHHSEIAGHAQEKLPLL